MQLLSKNNNKKPKRFYCTFLRKINLSGFNYMYFSQFITLIYVSAKQITTAKYICENGFPNFIQKIYNKNDYK